MAVARPSCGGSACSTQSTKETSATPSQEVSVAGQGMLTNIIATVESVVVSVIEFLLSSLQK
jgi:hypothetical protein